jgi:hypothetical protein
MHLGLLASGGCQTPQRAHVRLHILFHGGIPWDMGHADARRCPRSITAHSPPARSCCNFSSGHRGCIVLYRALAGRCPTQTPHTRDRSKGIRRTHTNRLYYKGRIQARGRPLSVAAGCQTLLLLRNENERVWGASGRRRTGHRKPQGRVSCKRISLDTKSLRPVSSRSSGRHAQPTHGPPAWQERRDGAERAADSTAPPYMPGWPPGGGCIMPGCPGCCMPGCIMYI